MKEIRSCGGLALEPLNKERLDWQTRYASAFRLNEDA
jgi:hypothetical protein